MKKLNNGFQKCCAIAIKGIWDEYGGSMNILRMTTNCPVCNHFIGITQTSKKEANKFLKEYKIS